ncbi:hypothetical protein [Salinicoccus sp. Marseille-QA3877]
MTPEPEIILALISLIGVLIPFTIKIIRLLSSDDIDLDNDKRNIKNRLKTIYTFLLFFVIIMLILLLFSYQFIQQFPNEWLNIDDRQDYIFIIVFFYIFISLILSLYFSFILSNLKNEVFILLDENLYVNGNKFRKKYILISKNIENNIATIKIKDPINPNVLHEKSYNLIDNPLSYEYGTINNFKAVFKALKKGAPFFLRMILMILFFIILIASLRLTISMFSGFYNIYDLINDFSIPLVIIFFIISLTSLIPLILSLFSLLYSFKHAWYKK